jgi:tripartite-type tricarboxylate transporter receptor subunit TctC
MNDRSNAPMNVVVGTLAAMLIALLASSAGAQTPKPSQVGQIVVGVPAGSNIDVTARILADNVSKASGQTYVVMNRPGAGGTIAAEMVARSPADGMTLFVSPISTMVTEPQVNRQNVRYDPFKDFAPISIVATVDLALAVGPALRVDNFANYLAAVHTDETKGFFTSPGVNGLPHFLGMLIAKQSGAKFVHVPYGGPGPAVQAVVGGHVPALIVGYSDLIALHRGGTLRILATSGTSRHEMTPEVPTFKELGYPFEVSVWYGVFAPGGTPPAVIERLNKLIVDAASSKQLSEYLVNNGHRMVGSTQQALADAHRNDFQRWGDFIRSEAITVK